MKIIYLFLTVIFYSCATIPVTYPVYFEPVEKKVKYIYQNGTPIVSYQIDSLFVLFSIEEFRMLEKNYFRLWVLFHNKSSEDINVEPTKIFKLNAKINDDNLKYFVQGRIRKMEGSFNAIKPSVLTNYINNVAANEMIMKSVGAALQSISVQNTKISSQSGTVLAEVSDAQEKRNSISSQLSNDLQSTSSWYSLYSKSVSQGLLRRNTIMPEQSVNGYVFFEHKINELYTLGNNSINFDFILDVNIFDKQEKIKLKAVQGE